MSDAANYISISDIARDHPDRPAAVLYETGETISFKTLDDDSKRLAGLLRSRGLGFEDRVAILMENCLDYFVAIWGVRRAGMLMVPVNWHLAPDEVRHVVQNSGARALITTASLRDAAAEAAGDLDGIGIRLAFGSAGRGFEDFTAATADVPPVALKEELDGAAMYYSGGTSGKPKGILRPLSGERFGAPSLIERHMAPGYGLDFDTIYLSPAPMYHASPFGWTMMVQRLGGTVILLRSFEASNVLKAIEQYRITHAQFVPTHFVRMLRLDDAERAAPDLSSLKVVVHAAAPCPPEVKRRMIEWLGPIVYEYYGSSEQCGFTIISPSEVASHPGSVGRAQYSIIHIVDGETGEELPAGEIGLVYFEGTERFEYHGDPGAADACFNARGWATMGDVGRLDQDGYLYLADRETNMILSGGVNIYPQEAEEVLITHPDVVDVAVIGLPDEEFGNRVHAVVVSGREDFDETALAAELIEYCRTQLAGFKCPRTVDFITEMPRLPTGKLQKRHLVAQYRAAAGAA